ncbi:calcium/sodium antiporter [Parvularcula marina]|uniref:calcium/sodium antiporter n=1 Tax=Parvularcula marina TaxID=2292771 RepID=UPI003515E9FC
MLADVGLDIGLVIVGIVLLLVGGDWLVRGAVSLAAHLGIPSLLIGLTIVAFGTSAPELVVSIQAVLAGNNGIAVGNIVGSNIANILLVLGLPAMIAPIAFHFPGLKRHTGVMLVATALFAYIVYSRESLDMQMGLVLLAGILVYVGYVAYAAMRPGSPEKELIESEVMGDLGAEDDAAGMPIPKTLFFLIAGLVLLPVGATLLVNSGADLASVLGVRDELIGLTIVAFGTSLPELATVWAAARKNEADVACGNIVGSNIFNILFVGGAMGVTGTTSFAQSEALKLYDLPMMIASALVVSALIFSKGRISRPVGVIFVIAYLAYIVLIGAKAEPVLPA